MVKYHPKALVLNCAHKKWPEFDSNLLVDTHEAEEYLRLSSARRFVLEFDFGFWFGKCEVVDSIA